MLAAKQSLTTFRTSEGGNFSSFFWGLIEAFKLDLYYENYLKYEIGIDNWKADKLPQSESIIEI